MSVFIALVELDWLPPEQGGRKHLPTGPTYAATAYCADESLAEFFSVVMRFLDPITPGSRTGCRAELRLLAPATVRKTLTPGSKLVITEGPQPVAQCSVVSVREESTASCANKPQHQHIPLTP